MEDVESEDDEEGGMAVKKHVEWEDIQQNRSFVSEMNNSFYEGGGQPQYSHQTVETTDA